MHRNKAYTGIDCFRFLAAILIVAIHTSPFGGVSDTADFILTRVIARVAVPFFFMTSGYFLISRYARNGKRLTKFLKKTALLYLSAMLLYVPVQLYNGYFAKTDLLQLVKDVIFNGTMYHLWYLSAAMLGGWLAWHLVRRLDFAGAFGVSAVLYAIGLLGDSYFGLAKLAGLQGLYDQLFTLFDYTRNGIFFAPVFFVLGGWLAKRQPMPKKLAIPGLALSFAAMLAEALLLRHFGWQKHDSMYVFLLPVMLCLFELLRQFEGKRKPLLRDSALVLYIIHPMVIVALRLFAKLTGLEALLIYCNPVHFLAVALSSAAAALLWAWLKKKRKKPAESHTTERAWLRLSTANLIHNAHVLRGCMQPGCRLMAVVKAQAYGHGDYETATFLEEAGVDAFAVATLDEGIALRKEGIRSEILVLGYTAPQRAKDLKKYDLCQTLISAEHARDLNAQGYPIRAHLKIDTGMHRLGMDWQDGEQLQQVLEMKNLRVEGIFTHLCVSDSRTEEDEAFSQEQIRRFRLVLEEVKKTHPTIRCHIQSSYGLLNYPELQCDYARMGVSLYGVTSSPDDVTRLQPELLPTLSLHARVAMLRSLKAGESMGYGRAFTAQRDSRIAIVPLGYADGYPRSLSCGRGKALLCGKEAPVAGRICMDQLALDVTDIPEAEVGSIATFIGIDGDREITTPQVAEAAGTISNEILSRMGRRLKLEVTE